MRSTTLAGIVLLLIGGFIVFRGLSYRSDRSVLKVGDLEAKVEERRAVPTWVGGIVLLGGLALLASGARRGKS
jgi:hypothetical protein